jgi:signal transduction histidine kinase/DNA-binding response OmpR family regulator/ligand-binding sensor domain-containing protein
MIQFSVNRKSLALFNLLILLLFSNLNLFSQVQLSHFNESTRYTAENGLGSTYSSEIQEDAYGFLWIATANGVSRFDGNHFTNYEYFYKNLVAHKIGFVNALKIDNSGKNIYISTNLGVFNTSIDTIEFNLIHGEITAKKRVNDILFDAENNIWVASTNGLIKLNADTHHKEGFTFENNFKLNQLQCLVKDSKNSSILWIGTLGGLIKFDLISKKYETYIFENKIEMAQNHIRKIAVSDKEIFLGTWNEGFIIFNKKTHQFTQPTIKKFPNTHKLILDIYNDNNSNLWVTSANGIIHYKTSSNRSIEIQNHDFKKRTIRGISFIDSRGIIWFGYKNGLFKYHSKPYKSNFLEFEPRTELETPFLIKEMIPYNNFMYVAGQYSEGLYKLNKDNNSIKTIKIPSFKYFDNKGYVVMDMALMHTKNILLISSNKIAIFNLETEKITLSKLQVNHPNPSFQTVLKDNNNNYWIGSREGGLFCLNFENNTIKNYKDEFNIYSNKNHRWINNLHIDSENKLWIGKGSASATINLDDLSMHVFNPEQGDDVKTYKDVQGFYEDSKKRIWMASDSEGLGYTDIEGLDKGVTPRFDGNFHGIYRYNDSLLWTIGAQLGQFNIKNMSHKPIKLHVDKGTLKIRGPIVNYTNDTYLIGSNNGVIIYNPIKKEVNYKIPQPYVRKIIGNGKILYERNDLKNKKLSFESKTNYLIFSISSLGFNRSNQTTYQYKINDDWINLDQSKEVNITNLIPGDYSFQIKACNSVGTCTNSPTTYNFTIRTPWHKSWWAFALYGIFIWTVGILLYKFNLNRKTAVADKQKAIEFNELKSTMYANISHEFRTPLTIINGLSKVLIEQGFEEESIEKIRGINDSGNQLLYLVNQMLELVSFDANKVTVTYKNADIIQFIEKCVSFYKFYADSKGVKLIFSSKVSSLQMDFDDNKLQKILNNVLSNAIKFTPEKGVVTVQIGEENQILILKISDTGQGIAPEHVPHIFERHYKTFDVDNNLGNGIGMALTKELITILQGSISVESVLEKGTEFIILLPINDTIKNSAVAVHQIPFIETTTIGTDFIEISTTTATILLVEDNKEIQNFIKLLLGNLYTIHIANNGIEGLEIATNKPIDFIISDVMMPKMNGFEFCKRIKKDTKTSHIPFIMVTAKSDTEDKLKGYKLGVDAYLLKPFNKEELLLIIKNLLLKQQEKINYFSKLLELKKQSTKVTDINQLDLDFIKSIQEIALLPHKISIEDITQKLAISRTQLHKKIKTLTGKSITHYINYIRIEKAKTLLKESTLQINEIAFELGFESANYFTRIFKKETGKTPFGYREKPHL